MLNSSGSLAMFAAILRASSFVSNFAADRRSGKRRSVRSLSASHLLITRLMGCHDFLIRHHALRATNQTAGTDHG
jgi:hypothetical protein